MKSPKESELLFSNVPPCFNYTSLFNVACFLPAVFHREQQREQKKQKQEEKKAERKRKAEEAAATKKDKKPKKDKRDKEGTETALDGDRPQDHRSKQRVRGSFDPSDPEILQLPAKYRIHLADNGNIKSFLNEASNGRASLLRLKKGAVRKICMATLGYNADGDFKDFINSTSKQFGMTQSQVSQSAKSSHADNVRMNKNIMLQVDTARILGFDGLLKGILDQGSDKGNATWVMDREKLCKLIEHNVPSQSQIL